MRAVLIGNYGVGNLGDEALKEYFLQAFPKVSWTVVSANPTEKNEVPRLPGGPTSFFTTDWGQTITVIKKANRVIFGGGSLLTDMESPYACFLWWLHARVAQLYGKPVAFAFQGIGPFNTKIGRYFACKALQIATHVSVRDELSYDRLETLGLADSVVKSFDPVLSLVKKISSAKRVPGKLIVIPRKQSGHAFVRLARDFAFEYTSLSIVRFQPFDEGEHRATLAISRDYEDSTMVPVTTIEQAVKEIATADMVLSHRFHGSLIALALRKKVTIATQTSHDKHESLKQLEQSVSACKKKVAVGKKALSSWIKKPH